MLLMHSSIKEVSFSWLAFSRRPPCYFWLVKVSAVYCCSIDGSIVMVAYILHPAYFLNTWCVKHNLSSVAYPQSHGRGEFALKAAKRIVNDIMDPEGSLDNDKASRTISHYHNTLIQGIGLYSEQFLLHH